jgi:hypothetical protein
MDSMPVPATSVTVGVDTHLETHVAAVIDQTGRLLGTQGFPASTRGYVPAATGLWRQVPEKRRLDWPILGQELSRISVQPVPLAATCWTGYTRP